MLWSSQCLTAVINIALRINTHSQDTTTLPTCSPVSSALCQAKVLNMQDQCQALLGSGRHYYTARVSSPSFWYLTGLAPECSGVIVWGSSCLGDRKKDPHGSITATMSVHLGHTIPLPCEVHRTGLGIWGSSQSAHNNGELLGIPLASKAP